MPRLSSSIFAAVVLAGAASGTALAADQPRLTTAAQLAAQVGSLTDGASMVTTQTGPGATVLAVRRTQTGPAELHAVFNDVLLMQSGTAQVDIGDHLEGGHQTAPGEWRGGAIPAGKSFPLAPGDMLWIPAGQPHQVIVPAGGDVRYLAFKYAIPTP